MDLTSAITSRFPAPQARGGDAVGWRALGWRAREWRAREWRLGWRFGRRLTRLPPPQPSPAPLYSLGTAARIERLRSWYEPDGRVTEARPAPVFQRWQA